MMSQIISRRRFLGVRQRPSGRWVAEIKVSSQKLRLWLGTFDRAEDAAVAYDRAARLLRGTSAKTNFQYDDDHHHHGSLSKQHSPKLCRLIQHAVLKNRGRGNHNNDNNNNNNNGFVVEETIFCSSSPSSSSSSNFYLSDQNGCCGFSYGNSKVYTSVFVAPSFSSNVTREEQGGEIIVNPCNL